MSELVLRLLQSSVCFGTVIMYGAIGEILTEKSGNLNLGVPGIMYLGGISGLAAAFFYEFNNPDPNAAVCLILSFLAAFLASALGGLLYSFLTISLRANQNVTGRPSPSSAEAWPTSSAAPSTPWPAAWARSRWPPPPPPTGPTSPPWPTWARPAAAVQLRLYGLSGHPACRAAALVPQPHPHGPQPPLGGRKTPLPPTPPASTSSRYKYWPPARRGISGLGGLYYTMDYIKGTWASEGTIEAWAGWPWPGSSLPCGGPSTPSGAPTCSASSPGCTCISRA